MKVWGLYTARVDPYHAHELIELFADESTAQQVKAELIGKQARWDMHGWVWEDDEDFPDLIVSPLDVRQS